MSEDKEKQERQINERCNLKISEKDSDIKSMEKKLKQVEAQLKQREDDSFKKVNEFEKLNALIEQKLQLTEKELLEYKSKYSSKDADYKEINKELFNSKKELQQLTNQMHRQE